MSDKILTSWHPVIRWCFLPFACILTPFVLSIILSLFLPSEGSMIWDGRGYYTISNLDIFFYEKLSLFVFSIGIILPIIYLAPSHTKLVVTIVRWIMIILFIFLYLFILLRYSDQSFYDYIISFINLVISILGLFIDKIFDIND